MAFMGCPFFAMGCPSRAVAALSGVPGTFRRMEGTAPPTVPPLLTEIKKAIAVKASKPNVSGMAMAKAIMIESPGVAPTICPTVTPITIYSKF